MYVECFSVHNRERRRPLSLSQHTLLSFFLVTFFSFFFSFLLSGLQSCLLVFSPSLFSFLPFCFLSRTCSSLFSHSLFFFFPIDPNFLTCHLTESLSLSLSSYIHPFLSLLVYSLPIAFLLHFLFPSFLLEDWVLFLQGCKR